MGLFDWLGLSARKSALELLAEARQLAAEGRFKDALSVYGKIKRRDWTAVILVEMGQTSLSAGRTLVALDYAREALDRDPKCAGAICIQGEVLLSENRNSEANRRFEQALRIDPSCEWARRHLPEETATPEEPKSAAQPLDSAGAKQSHAGGMDATLAREKVKALGNMALERRKQGNSPDAIGLAQQALQLAEMYLGPAHVDTATCLHNLGCILQDIGDLAEARTCHERALQIRQKVLGDEHPDTAVSRNNLAVISQALNQQAGSA